MTNVLKNFVALEGIDGAGTTTQLRRITAACAETGVACHPTCEPTVMESGRLIRKVLSGEVTVRPQTLARMFVTDRYEHLYGENGIIAHLNSGELVVTDRYLFSSLAYQSVECGYDSVFELNKEFPLPQVLIYLDIPAEVGDLRSARRGNREIFENSDFQQRVIRMYDRAITSHTGLGMEVLRVDGTQSEDSVFEKIWSRLKRLPIEDM